MNLVKSPKKSKNNFSQIMLTSGIKNLSKKLNNKPTNTNSILKDYIHKKLLEAQKGDMIIATDKSKQFSIPNASLINNKDINLLIKRENLKKRTISPINFIKKDNFKFSPVKNDFPYINTTSIDTKNLNTYSKSEIDFIKQINVKSQSSNKSKIKSRNIDNLLSKNSKSYLVQKNKNKTTINQDSNKILYSEKPEFLNKQIDSFNILCSENGKVKNILDTSLSDNAHINLVDTKSLIDNNFFKDERYIDLLNENISLKEELNSQYKNIEYYRITAEIVDNYLKCIQEFFSSKKCEFEQSLEKIRLEYEEMKKKYENVLNQNKEIKLKFIRVLTLFYENDEYLQVKKQNDKLMHQLVLENEYLRKMSEKNIYTEIIQKEIILDNFDYLDKFKTNYLEEYKKLRNNRLIDEFNSDNSILSTIQSSNKENNDNIMQNKSHFVFPPIKQKPKRKLKITEEILDKKSETDEEINKNLYFLLEPSPFLKNYSNKKEVMNSPNLLNENFEIAPQSLI